MKYVVLHSFTEHSGPVYTLHFRRDAALMYSGSADGMVALWDVMQQKSMPFLVKVGKPVYSLLELEDQLLIGQSEGGIHIVDINSRVELRHLKYHQSGVFSLIYVNRSGYVVAAGGDGKLSIIDALDFRLLHSLKLSAQKLRCLCLSENEQLLLTGGSDGFIRMLDTAYLNELESVKAHDGGVYAIHQLTDGRYVSGGRDAHLRFWEWKEGRLLQVNAVPAHNYAIYAISSVRGSTFFASASRDKTAKVWDLDNLNAPSRLFRKGDKGHTHSVNTCAFSPDGELLVTAGDDSKIILWKPSTE